MIELGNIIIPPTGSTRALAISPDGTLLVVAGSEQESTRLYAGRLDRFEARAVPGTEGARNPFFSPDGEWIGFFAGGELRKTSLAGGSPQTICPAPADSRGASWGPDDHIVFAPTGASGLYRVPAAGGSPTVLTTPDAARGEHSHRWPELLPGGTSVLFTVWGSYEAKEAPIAALSLETGERRELLRGGTDARYVPTGHLVYAKLTGLFAVPFDPKTLRVTGPERPLPQKAEAHPVSGVANFAIAPTGALVYVEQGNAFDHLLVWVDRRGKSTRASDISQDFWYPRVSADGRIAVRIVEEGGRRDIWIYEGGTSRRLIPEYEGENLFPAWTRDGRRVTFNSERGGSLGLYWRPLDGGVTELLLSGKNQLVPGSWTRDGRFLAFYEVHPSTQRDIWILPMEDERHPRPLVVTPFNELAPMFSPDDRWIAFVSNRSGRNEVYLYPFAGSGEPIQITTEGGAEAVWGPDGSELFFRNGNRLMRVSIATDPELAVGEPQVLFEGAYRTNPYGNPSYDVAPDGKRFLMIRPGSESSARLRIAHGWVEELERRVPSHR